MRVFALVALVMGTVVFGCSSEDEGKQTKRHKVLVGQRKIKTTEIKMNEAKKAVSTYTVNYRGLPDKLSELTNPKKGPALIRDTTDDFGNEFKYEHAGRRALSSSRLAQTVISGPMTISTSWALRRSPQIFRAA